MKIALPHRTPMQKSLCLAAILAALLAPLNAIPAAALDAHVRTSQVQTGERPLPAEAQEEQGLNIRRHPSTTPPPSGIQRADVASAQDAAALGWPSMTLQTPHRPAEILTYALDANATDATSGANEQPPATARTTIAAASAAAPGRLAIAPQYLHFAQTPMGLAPLSQSLQISNPSGNPATFTLAESIPWLHISATTGVAAAEPFTLSLQADAAGLSPAVSPYTGVITVTNLTDPSDVHTVHVRLAVTGDYASATLTSFDGAGNLQRRIKPDGAVIDYAYDAVGRLLTVRYPNGSMVAYTYDDNGNRTSMTDSHGTTYYAYDAENRLSAVYFPGLEPVQYAYDNASNLTLLTYPDGRSISYTYDTANRMTTVYDGNGTTTYAYDGTTGYLASQTLPNGVRTAYAYDIDGRLTGVTHQKADNSLLMAFHYTLDANGMRTAAHKQTPAGVETTSYIYDNLLRLSQVTYPDGQTVSYSYDALGNRLRMVDSVNGITEYLYDAGNRLLSAGDEVFAYDANGNTVRRVSPARTIEYTWDAENRLVGYADGQHLVTFEYDGDGNRVAKTADGVRTNYINDLSGPLTQVLLTATGDGQVDQEFIYGLDRVGMNDGGYANWRYYSYESPLRSVAAVSDGAASIIETPAHDAFGNAVKPPGAPPVSFRAVGSFGYNGEQYDSETGLIYLRHRYYDASLGRYLSRDAFPGLRQQPQTTQPYAFAQNNPVNFIDPSGDIALVDTLVGAGIGAFAGVAGTYAGDVVTNFSEGKGLLGSFAPTSSWQTYAGSAIGGGAAGAMVTINPFLVGATAGAVSNLATQSLEALTGERTGFDAGSLGADVALGGLFGGLAGTAISRGPGRPPTKLWTKVFGKISQRENWAPIAVEAALDAGWGTLTRGFVDGRWTIDSGDLGGVTLNKTAELMLQIDDLTGASYDAKTGQIVLYGRQDAALPQMNMNDLAVAVHSIFGGQDPAVSIDPPLVNNNFSVRYEGQTAETDFGWIMFEADRVMKTLSMGKDNITGLPVTSNVPDFQTMLQRELASGDCTAGAQWSDRFWFQPKEVKLVRSSDGQSMVFDTVSIELLTEYTLGGGTPGQEANPEAEAFVAHFTEHYDEFAAEFPIFNDLKRLAKVVAVIKWIKDNQIPIDLGFVDDYDIAYFDTPETTPATTVQADNGSCIMTVQGGVAFTPPNEYLADNLSAPVAGAMAAAAIDGRPAEEQFAWSFEPPALLQILYAAQANGPQMAVAETFARSRKDGNISFSQTDLHYPADGGYDLELTRFYDSFADRPADFGTSWTQLPFALRFTAGKRTFTFGSDATPMELYEQISVADRLAGREDTYTLVGSASNGLPLYRRPGASDILWALLDGSFVLAQTAGSEIAFDASGRITTLDDSNANRIRYLYDGSGRLTRLEGPDGRAIVLTVDAAGRIVQAADPGGRVVHYAYDGEGNLATVTDGAGQVSTYAYDASHRLTGAWDPMSRPIFAVVYDAYARAVDGRIKSAATFARDFSLAQRITVVTHPLAGQSVQRFDDRYRLIETVDPLGYQHRIQYLGDWGPTVITGTDGTTTQLLYDQYGDVIVTIDGEGARTDLWYDDSHQLVAARDPQGIETAYTYDANRNLTHIYHDARLVLDANGDLASWYYDPNNMTTFSYGLTGNLVTTTDPRGNVRQFEYDASGLLVATHSPGSTATHLTYDTRARIDSLQTGGSLVDFHYDDADNLIGIATAAGQVGYSYDQAGNTTQVVDAASHSTQFSYDADGNLSKVVDAAGQTTTYTYDALGHLREVSLPNGARTAYEYDELGRLAVAYTAGVATSQLVAVDPGWSLLSLRVEPAVPQLPQVLQFVAGRFDRVFGDGLFYNPSVPPTYNTLHALHAGAAYYLRLSGSAAAGLLVEGTPLPPNTPLPLQQGWNMLGYLPGSAMPVATALGSIAGKYSIVLSIDKTYDPAHPAFSTLAAMQPGQGYLIHMNEAATLVYPTAMQSTQILPQQTDSPCLLYRTPQFTLAYAEVHINGAPAPAGAHVEAVNAAGQVIGCGQVRNTGRLGFLHIYGVHDDGDIGARAGETVGWRINGLAAAADEELVWQNDRTGHFLQLNAAGTRQFMPIVSK